jgi:hypothetical protein
MDRDSFILFIPLCMLMVEAEELYQQWHEIPEDSYTSCSKCLFQQFLHMKREFLEFFTSVLCLGSATKSVNKTCGIVNVDHGVMMSCYTKPVKRVVFHPCKLINKCCLVTV